MHRRPWTHYAAPAAFLLAVTVLVLVVRSGLDTEPVTETSPPIPTLPRRTVATTTATKKKAPARTTTRARPAPAAQYYTVVAGDTFGVISSKTGTSVEELERLNPGVESTALYIGQRIRVR